MSKKNFKKYMPLPGIEPTILTDSSEFSVVITKILIFDCIFGNESKFCRIFDYLHIKIYVIADISAFANFRYFCVFVFFHTPKKPVFCFIRISFSEKVSKVTFLNFEFLPENFRIQQNKSSYLAHRWWNYMKL